MPSTNPVVVETDSEKRSWRFWLIFLSLCLCIFLCALDMGSMATALPVIVHDLHGSESFAWVSTAYTLSTTSVLPLSGRLADLFGRRDVLLAAIILFAVGSALCAAAQSMAMLVIGRAVQGLGSGGIQALTSIVVADIVVLKKRGFFNAITGATFSMATAAGPFVGGAIVQKTSWRWLFYINFPMCFIAFVVVCVFLRLNKPPRPTFKESMLSMDWIGNIVIIGSTTSCIIALTWAGVTYSWSSPRVLVPLIIGVAGLIIAMLYEVVLAHHPMIPSGIISNRTSISGYFGSFVHGLVITNVTFYLPVYFQATKVAPPLLSGLYVFPMVIMISPSAIVQGILISKYGHYRLMNGIGWSAMFVGVGLLCILGPNTPVAVSVPFQMIAAVGFGFLYATTFSVLAPLEVSANASALSFLLFARTFSKSWGVAIGATILQNQLLHHLPQSFLDNFTSGQDITYSSIPQIHGLPEPLQDEVRNSFSRSLVILWKIMLVLCGIGLVSVFIQKEIPLHSKKDEKWGIDEGRKDTTVDAVVVPSARERSPEKESA